MKKIISSIMAVAILFCLFSVPVSASAVPPTQNMPGGNSAGNTVCVVPNLTTEVQFQKVSLSQTAISLRSGGVADVRLNGNTLTYTLPDGTKAKIVETVIGADIRILEITEGLQSDILAIDYGKNEVLVNGSLFRATRTEAAVYSATRAPNQMFAAAVTWIKMGNTSFYNATSGNQIRDLLASSVYQLISGLFNALGGFFFSSAVEVLNWHIAEQSASKSVYVGHELFCNQAVPYYHYLEKIHYYSNSDYTYYITTSSKELFY